MTMTKQGYSFIIPEETIARTADYLGQLSTGSEQPGTLLRDALQGVTVNSLHPYDLIGRLLDTKPPRIYAETEVSGDGSDWNQKELSVLGDISVAVPVTIFDDGNHYKPTPHAQPFSGRLIFVPGALLRNGKGIIPADWNEVTKTQRTLSAEGYYQLYRRRLLPVLNYINQSASAQHPALLTIPGLGCGQFAGPFQGQLGEQLKSVLFRLLTEHGASLPNLKVVYFDPYNECESSLHEIKGISFRVRPFMSETHRKSQLCHPTAYEEQGDDFSNCALYSIVAWDHVSWPGNDFYVGSRATDDGVKAAATNTMAMLTGVEGKYDPSVGKYLPPQPYHTWEDLIHKRDLRLWNPQAVW